jgi:hypothetical protein
VLEIVEIAADRRQGGRDDGLVECCEEHGDEHADDDRANVAVTKPPAFGGIGV